MARYKNGKGVMEMNEKPLNRYELEETFKKFSYIPHINKVKVAGRIDDVAKQQFQYASSRNYGKKLPMYRTIVEVLSVDTNGKPIKIGAEGNPYVSHIPMMCVGDLAEGIASQKYEAGIFVQGTGRVQNYKVAKPCFADQEQIEYLMKALCMNDPEDGLITEILNIFNLNGQKESQVKMTVSAREMSLSENNDFVNEVTLQGFVYMPPSLRYTRNNDIPSLHLKMVINRPDDLGPLPDSAVAERDEVNVVFYGEKASELYPKLKQGYPIMVKGRIESDKYRPKIEVDANGERKKKLVALLGVTEQHPILDEILTSCGRKNKEQTFIKHDILGDLLEISSFLPAEEGE